MKISGLTVIALSTAALLAALSFVTWRQSRALEALAEWDGLRRELSLVRAEQGEFARRIQVLESRGRIVPEARERLGMKTPTASEIVILPGGAP